MRRLALARPGSAACAAALLAVGLGAAAAEPEIAYLAHTDGYWQVWVMAADGSGARQVTRSPSDKSRCSWYPGGAHLLVNAQDGHLYRVAVDTGAEQRLDLGVAGMLDAVLSPDGETIAFSLQRMSEDTPSGDSNDIWVVAAAGGEPRRLAKMKGLQAEPAWSSDSRWVYFFSAGGVEDHDIHRISLDGSRRAQLTSAERFHFDVAVSPAGQLAYSGNQTGNYEIWVQGEGEAPRALTDHPATDARPSWSPDGSALVFESSRDGRLNVFKVAASGGEPMRLTDHPVGARAPVWRTRREAG
jgi:TolB protein